MQKMDKRLNIQEHPHHLWSSLRYQCGDPSLADGSICGDPSPDKDANERQGRKMMDRLAGNNIQM